MSVHKRVYYDDTERFIEVSQLARKVHICIAKNRQHKAEVNDLCAISSVSLSSINNFFE